MRHIDGWLAFAGCVLNVAVLYWAQVVLVPISLAILITFVLTPPVAWLQRRIGRGAAVVTVVVLVFTATILDTRRYLAEAAHVGTPVEEIEAPVPQISTPAG